MPLDPVSGLAIGAGSAAIGTALGLIGNALAQGDHDKARQIRQQIADQYGSMVLPELDKQVAQEMGPTALASIQEDTALRGQQTSAMRRLADIYESGGMTKQDEAALQLADQGAQARAASDYSSMQQQLASRGQSLNPALAAALASKSSGDVVKATATNRYQAQADARNRAMQALGQSAELAGGIRGQDYGIKSAAANAADRIAQFNAAQRTAANTQNLQSQQQGWQNQMALQGARANAQQGMASDYDAAGNRTAQAWGGAGQGVSTLGAGVMQYADQSNQHNPDGSRKKP